MPIEHDNTKRRRPLRRFAALFVLALLVLLGSALLRHPDTPLPPQWNVFEPLDVNAEITPITQWKLDWASSDPALCLKVLGGAARMREKPFVETSQHCSIESRVILSAVGRAVIEPIETSCATALRLAMWERHGLQSVAREMFGANVARIRQVGSYNCRRIAGTERWSTHATADAIGVIGFDLTDGTRISLLRDWNEDDDKARFLRRVRDSSCKWFGTTLGPDYNDAHADHFHLQNEGWGTCR